MINWDFTNSIVDAQKMSRWKFISYLTKVWWGLFYEEGQSFIDVLLLLVPGPSLESSGLISKEEFMKTCHERANKQSDRLKNS